MRTKVGTILFGGGTLEVYVKQIEMSNGLKILGVEDGKRRKIQILGRSLA